MAASLTDSSAVFVTHLIHSSTSFSFVIRRNDIYHWVIALWLLTYLLPCAIPMQIRSLVPGNKCHSSLYFHCLVRFSVAALIFLKFLYMFSIEVCFVLLIMNDANWTTGLFLSRTTGRFEHQRLFIHHIRIGPLHVFKLLSSWICTSRQLHKVTSGPITVTVSSHQVETQGTKTQTKSWLTVLPTTRSIANTHQPKQSIMNTSHNVYLQKILPDSLTHIQYKI